MRWVGMLAPMELVLTQVALTVRFEQIRFGF